MRVIKGISNIAKKFKDPAVALGVFDGMHLGHQRIIKRLICKAKALGSVSVVITFDPHPLKSFYENNVAPLITSLDHRIALIESLGADVCLVLNFDQRFARISAEEFIRHFLVRSIGVRHIVVGEGFRFGQKKQGTLSLLRRLGKEDGFSVEAVKPVRVNSCIISSSRIRMLIQKGKVKQANELLGRNFSIHGKVTKGCARGRLLGYPTANIQPEQEIVPAYGVYAAQVKLKNKTMPGILNVGCRPTFYHLRKFSPVIEVHIFNFRNTIYNQKLEVFFLARIRAERKFTSREALLRQIKKDEIKAKAILK